MKTKDSIFLLVASYMDLELADTIYSALSQSKNPQNIFVSVFSQDEDHKHPKLENLFQMFDVLGYSYNKINYQDARGVGFARAEAQKSLTDNYEYYVQVDSHTQFVKNWDEILIDDYRKAEEFWQGKVILTAYPSGYLYTPHGNLKVPDEADKTCLKIKYSDNDDIVYDPKYKDWEGNEYGDYHGYFCAGFAFGRSEYFIQVPYDSEIYFNGEEQTMSIRFYCNDIKLIAPARCYIYHNYDGERRGRNWEKTSRWKEFDEKGKERLREFFAVKDLGIYGITDLTKYAEWIGKFVKQSETTL